MAAHPEVREEGPGQGGDLDAIFLLYLYLIFSNLIKII
jgi:hypothetical protein